MEKQAKSDRYKPQVLHIDDSDDFIVIFEKHFQDFFDITSAKHAEEALKILEEKAFSIIVTDYEMPEMNGLDLLKKVKESHVPTPVIFCTGQGSEEIARKAFLSGVSDYFTKELYDFAHKDRFVNSVFNCIAMNEAKQKHQQAEEELKQRLIELETIHKIGRNISVLLPMEDMADTVLKELKSAVDCDVVMIYTRDKDNIELVGALPAHEHYREVGRHVKKVGQCLCGLAAMENVSVFASDIHSDPRCSLNDCKKAGLRSFAALPLIYRGRNIGVLGLASINPRDFSSHKTFLESIAGEVSITMANVMLMEEKQSYVRKLEALVEKLEKKYA